MNSIYPTEDSVNLTDLNKSETSSCLASSNNEPVPRGQQSNVSFEDFPEERFSSHPFDEFEEYQPCNHHFSTVVSGGSKW